MKNIEQFLKSKEKDLLKFVSINDQLSKIKIDETMKNIIGSENDSIEINLRNLYILEIQLKTHLKQFERIQIENLLVSIDGIDQKNINQYRESIESRLHRIKSLLIDFYLIIFSSEIRTKTSTKDYRSDENSINKRIQYVVGLCYKLYDVKIAFSDLLKYFEKLYDHILNSELEFSQMIKVLDDIVDNIILEHFNINSLEINRDNINQTLSCLEILSNDYLYNKKDLFRKLLKDMDNYIVDDILRKKYLIILFKYCCLFCSLNENEIDIALKCLKSIIDKTWNIRLCSNVPESIANDQEIVIVKIDTTFSIYYRMNGQTEHCSIDNEQYVRSLSLVDFKQQTIPRDIYEKISTIVFEIIRLKSDINIQMNYSNRNRIIEYVRHHLDEIEFSVLEIEVHIGNDEQFEKLIKLFSTKEEKHAVHWILSFIGDKESEMKKLNDIFILKPVLSWYEELSEFKVELVRDRIFKKFSDDLEKTSDENRDKFQNVIRASLFFAENHRDSWFELMTDIISRNDEIVISLNDLMKIISLFAYFEDLSVLKQIVKNNKQTIWLFDILCARVEHIFKKIFTGNFYSELSNKLNHLKGKLRIGMDPQCLFLDTFGQLLSEYQNQESKQLQQNFSRFLIEFIDLVIQSRVDLDHDLLSRLSIQPLPMWKLSLEKKVLVNELDQIDVFQKGTDVDKSVTIDYLYKIGDEKGKDILENLLKLITNVRHSENKFTLSQLNVLLEELSFGGFTLDQESLEQLKDKSFDQWEAILKSHMEDQFRELNVEQLIKAMREKTGERKINEPIKHLLNGQRGETNIDKLLDRIYSFYGQQFNDKDKLSIDKVRTSNICTDLSSKWIMNWTKDDIRQWADMLREENRSHKEYFNWDKDFLPEIIAVIVRAVELYHGYHPRNIQLIALGIFLEPHSKEKGRLQLC